MSQLQRRFPAGVPLDGFIIVVKKWLLNDEYQLIWLF